MSSFIRGYVSSIHPDLDQRRISQLLSFNVQYLLKIADYSLLETGILDRNTSPLFKRNLTYHRDYEPDNRLLIDGMQPLAYMWCSDLSALFFVGNKTFKYLAKMHLPLISIYEEDTDAKIAEKIDERCVFLDSLEVDNAINGSDADADQKTIGQIGRTFVLIHISSLDCDKINHLVNKVNGLFYGYSFSDDRKKQVFSFLMSTHIFFENGHTKFVVSRNDGVFKALIKHSGSTPTIQAAAELYTQFNTLGELNLSGFYEKLMPDQTIPEEMPMLSTPWSYPFTMQKQINAKLLFALKQKYDSTSTHIRILYGAMYNLIIGLFSENCEQSFSKLGYFLCYSAERIDALLEKCLLHTKLSDVMNDFDVLIEEILLILSVAQPYKRMHFHESMRPMIGPWPIPFSIKMTQSCTQATTEIIYNIIKEKSKQSPAKILYFDDIYFETQKVISNLKQNLATVFKVETTVPGSLENIISNVKESDCKLEALFIDLHSSPKSNRRVQQSHDVIATIEFLMAQEVVSDHFTICIDNTIGILGSDEIKEVLEKYSEQIDSGKFCILICQSLHKLHIFGCDKFSAGCYLIYGSPATEFVLRFSNISGGGLHNNDLQSYTHIFTWCSALIKNYYHAIVSNNISFYERIKQKYLFESESDSRGVGVVLKKDKMATYCEISLENREYYQKLLSDLRISKIFSRDSFGYPRISYLSFPSAKVNEIKVRITIGLEDASAIKKYARILNLALGSM